LFAALIAGSIAGSPRAIAASYGQNSALTFTATSSAGMVFGLGSGGEAPTSNQGVNKASFFGVICPVACSQQTLASFADGGGTFNVLNSFDGGATYFFNGGAGDAFPFHWVASSTDGTNEHWAAELTTSTLGTVHGQQWPGWVTSQTFLDNQIPGTYFFTPSGSNNNSISYCFTDTIGEALACGLTPPYSIAFTQPTNGTTTPFFHAWHLNETGLSTSTTLTIVMWDYATSTFLDFAHPWNDGALNNGTSSAVVVPSSIRPSPLATSTLYYAQAGIFEPGSSTPLAVSAVISFTIDWSLGVLQEGETSSTLSTGTSDCQYSSSSFISDPIGVIENSICNSLVFLFIPNTPEKRDISDFLSGIGTSVAHKPPFGYFSSFSEQISLIQNSSSSTSTPLLDTTSTTALAPVLAPLDAGTATIVWGMFALWGFHRARHIQL
jgi:hypothetical protein